VHCNPPLDEPEELDELEELEELPPYPPEALVRLSSDNNRIVVNA
jgi:hypothetical protein